MSNRMPVLFVGHGSPMNAVENNEFTETWQTLSGNISRPSAILSVSAHWFTDGERIQTAPRPRQVYDMYGFPQELYNVRFPATGKPELAEKVQKLVHTPVSADNSWGIDHGTWSVLCRMYPDADIPVVQLSVNRSASLQDQFELGRELLPLRDDGILILASGNIVHNLGMIDWDKQDGFGWADSFDGTVRDAVLSGNVQSIMNAASSGKDARRAVPTPDHFMPLLYALGASGGDKPVVFNDARTLGSLSMTGFVFG
ncbi:MAG: 4,5-DOPA dioxygenase extradiol [Treponema sp.]|nr:4,5-DOPA dioxygenase extradiol [Treponema sp.]